MIRAVALATLISLPALAQTEFSRTKGANHLIGINGVLGAGAASIIFIAALTAGPNRNLAVSGSAAVGMVALFLGGGLTAGHLLDPTPPMAWSSFWAGSSGAFLGLGLLIFAYPRGLPSVELPMLAMALGYVVGAGLDLALPGRDTLSWKDFWVPMVVAFIPGGALIIGGILSNSFRSPEFTAVAIFYPVVAFLTTRAIISAIRPFEPWFDDLQPPFRAEPFISIGPSGAMVGIAANW